MASTNFKIFAENAASEDVMTDSVYNADSQRKSGVAPGVALPSLHNKLYRQATIMPAALAQCIVQAGYDAKDSDYTGLVDGIKKTFAMKVNNVTPDATGNVDISSVIRTIRDEKSYVFSVNGNYPDNAGNVDISETVRDIRDEKDYVFSINNIKPDSKGNIDLSALIDEIKRAMYPRVGDIICTKDGQNPSARYPGTTWQLIPADTFLMSATASTVNKTGGSNTHTITAAEMPSHTHSVSCGDAGGHQHDRGDMDIWGEFTGVGESNGSESIRPKTNGAFYVAYKGTGIKVSNDGDVDDIYGFQASRHWTGHTSWCDNHSHSVSCGNAGGGSSYDSRPKYIGVYMWVRIS